MRPSAIVAGAMVLAAALAPTASAAPSSALTVEAARVQTVELTLARTTSFSGSWELRGSGRYKVALFGPVEDSARAGDPNRLLMIEAPEFAGRDSVGQAGDGGRFRFAPGRYRLTLISDRPVTLRWPVLTAKAPTTRAVSRWTSAELRAMPGSSSSPALTTLLRRDLTRRRDLILSLAAWELTGRETVTDAKAHSCLEASTSSECHPYLATAEFTSVGYANSTSSKLAIGALFPTSLAPTTGAAWVGAQLRYVGTQRVQASRQLIVRFG